MIQKRQFTFSTLSNFLAYKICVNKDNLHYITGSLSAPVQTASSYDDVDIMYQSVVLVKDNGNGYGVIWSMGSIIAYGLTPTQISQIESSLSGKQDKLVSGVNIKTINGQSILGSGNITNSIDTYTKSEIDSKISTKVKCTLAQYKSWKTAGTLDADTFYLITNINEDAEAESI